MENEEKLPEEFPDVEAMPEPEPKQPGDLAQTAAVQAVICCLAAAVLLILGGLEPDTGSAVFHRLKELAGDPCALIPNPIDLLIGLCGS